jgi:hypothetical protein
MVAQKSETFLSIGVLLSFGVKKGFHFLITFNPSKVSFQWCAQRNCPLRLRLRVHLRASHCVRPALFRLALDSESLSRASNASEHYENFSTGQGREKFSWCTTRNSNLQLRANFSFSVLIARVGEFASCAAMILRTIG